MSSQDKSAPDSNSGPVTADSTSGSISLSESTPSVLQLSDDTTATDSSLPSPVQQPSELDNKGSGDTSVEAGQSDDIQARIEKKRLEHEQQRALQRKEFEQQMARLEQQQREEERNLLQQRKASAASKSGHAGNHLANAAASAPTTPPNETSTAVREAGKHHPNVGLAVSAAVSPITSAVDADLNGATSNVSALAHLHRSMPTSRRQSQEGRGIDELSAAMDGIDIAGKPVSNKAAAAHRGLLSRVVDKDRAAGLSAGSGAAIAKAGAAVGTGQGDGFTPVFNERFLFDDELDNEDSAFVKKYNLQGDDDKFPILVRRDSFPDVLSAQSAALDRGAPSQSNNSNDGADAKSPHTSEWPQFGGANSDAAIAAAAAAANRKPDNFADLSASSLRGPSKNSPPHNVSGISTPFGSGAARQGTFPLPSPSPRLSGTGRSSPAINAFGSAQSRQASGPVSPSPALGGIADPMRSSGGSRFVNTAVGVQQNSGLKPHGVAAPGSQSSLRDTAFPSFNLGAFTAGSSGSESPNRFGPYSPNSFDASDPGRGSRPGSGFFDAFNPTAGANVPGSIFPTDKYSMGMVPSDSHGKLGVGPHGPLGKHPRKGELDAATRLEELQGEIFALCKDQHGCRFLQKKLEESNPNHRDMIFSETFAHFAELMTDPFGNYLCQKMLEFCTDEQRNLIVESVAPELVTISLNMHGTRAVQKMIDFLSTSRQIHSIIVALSMNVVTLIKDLNGNHVIQKCLNRLGAEDNQFIYNAVARHCVEVATHRHGCCVLQRCIDHASESQRIQLVAEITVNALALVQDPFGNYVVQYVLDLSNPRFTDGVVRQFVGNVCLLSVQKFSSNVIEKCIRVSEPGVRKQLIEELLNRTRLEKLLRDSFANYVVQTSLDYADPVQRMRLVECIRPILPVIRNTPYGKRIQSKLQRDNLDLGPPNGVPYSVLQAAHQQQLQAMAAMSGHRGGADHMGMNAYGHGYPSHHGGPQGQGQHLPPHLQHQMYGGGPNHTHGSSHGGPHHGGPPVGGHALPPPNFGHNAGGHHQGFGMNGGFSGNLPPPMGMQGGPPSAAGFSNNMGGGGFGNY